MEGTTDYHEGVQPQIPNDPITTLYTALRESHQTSSDNISRLADSLNLFLQVQTNRDSRPIPTSVGPRPREPKPYDGQRKDGALEDHIRDLTNWLNFYSARGHWSDETEKIESASTYLTSRVHRLFTLHRSEFTTVTGYCEWLKRTFQDRNEQAKLRNEWHQLIQGTSSVQEYATTLLYLRSRMEPVKSDNEVKDHFFMGLDPRLQMKIIENTAINDSLPLKDFMDIADRYEQIIESQHVVVKGTRTHDSGRVYAMQGAPRRGGRTPVTRPRKGTREWVQHCNKKDACYVCGREGHRARDCTQTDTKEEPLKKRFPFVKGRKDALMGKARS